MNSATTIATDSFLPQAPDSDSKLSRNVAEAHRRFRVAFAHRRSELRRQWVIGSLLLVVLIAIASVLGEVDLVHLWKRLPRFTSYFGRMVPDLSWTSLWPDLARWYWNGWVWLAALWQTVLIAIYATLIGLVFGFVASFFGARNLSPNTSSIFITRRLMELARTVPELVFAVLFVYSFGLGPLAGVLAIGLHSMGALGKLFADVAENVDLEQVKGVRSTGANWSQTMLYGVTPQVLPDYLSYGLLRLEINVRAASILGFVGAGGIGQELYTAVKSFNHTDISAIALMLIAAVIAIDSFCSWLRGRVIGRENLRTL